LDGKESEEEALLWPKRVSGHRGQRPTTATRQFGNGKAPETGSTVGRRPASLFTPSAGPAVAAGPACHCV